MRRVLTGLLAFLLACGLLTKPAYAQDQGEKNYRSDTLGFSFDYPADWVLREELAAQTVTLANQADIDAVAAGQAPNGLLFSATISTFRQVGADQVGDFKAVLTKITQAPTLSPSAIRVGGMDGLVADTLDGSQNVATRTIILSIGERRVAVLRGIATVGTWETGGSESQFNDLIDTFSFFPPSITVDSYGQVLWQLPATAVTDMFDIAASADASTLYVTSPSQGLWQVNANGSGGVIVKPDGVSSFADIGITKGGLMYLADPANTTIWIQTPGVAQLEQFFAPGASVVLGPQAPQRFTFGAKGLIYVLDESVKASKSQSSPRIQVFDKGGNFYATWSLPLDAQDTIENPRLSSDADGSVYIIGSNTPGIIKLNVVGKPVSQTLGKDALANSGAMAIAVDRFNNIYVATADQGILKLDPTGKLLGAIGEGYDEATPPKPGQLGKPVAMTLADNDRLLFVVDAGKYPQIVAFALNGDDALNVQAGTHDAGTLDYDQPVTGEIGKQTFVDMYSFVAKASDTVSITMQAGKGSKIDPYLEVVNSKGNQLAADDDAVQPGPGLQATDAQLEFKVYVDGTYYVRATRFGAETTTATGAYTLSLHLEKGPKP